MAVIAVKPFVLRNVTLSIGTDNYEAHVSEVTFTPSASQVSWTGLANNTVSATTTATWTVTIGYAQDWDTANSLAQYLHANEGTTVAVEFVPDDGQGTFDANVVLSPGAIGGTAGAFATSTVTLGCDKPVFTAAE
jgi:hypothetical protein